MKFLLSLIYASTTISSTTMPIIIQNDININKVKINKSSDPQININTLQEAFISFYNTMLLETKTQLTKIKFLFNETDTTIKNLITQIEGYTNLDISEEDNSKIVSYFSKMINSYEQFLRIILSLYDEPKSTVTENVRENYDADSTVRLYTRALNTSYRKLKLLFDQNINKIANILGENHLLEYYESFIKTQEINNPEEYPLTLADLEYLTTNILKDMSKRTYETNLAFSNWYNQLNQIIANSSKHIANSKEYYYVPKSDNANLNQLKSKVDAEIESDIQKVNDHLQRGVSMEFLYSTGNTITKTAPIVTNKVDFLYEIEIKISVRKEVLANSEIKEIKLDRVKIELIGTYAQQKIDASNKFQTEINDLQDKIDNFEVTGSVSFNKYIEGNMARERFTFAENFQYVNEVQNFEITELSINAQIIARSKSSIGGFERDFYFNNPSINLTDLSSEQKTKIAEAFTKNKGLNLLISSDYDRYTAESTIELITNSGTKILVFPQKGSYDAETGWNIIGTWIYRASISVKWKHKTDLDLNGWSNLIEKVKEQKSVVDKDIEYIEANFNIKK